MKHYLRSLMFLVVFFGILCFLRYSITALQVHAVNMDSDKYRIQFGTINSGGEYMHDEDNDTYTLTSSLGQAAAGQFESNGFIVKAGFQYVYSTIPFTFSVSNVRADLGSLMPNTPVSTPITLSVSFGGAGQYIVSAQEESPLHTIQGRQIPNTNCNSGCSRTLAGAWTSPTAYGFGYNMSGTDIPSDFVDNTYYRPFADQSIPESPVPIMQSNNVTFQASPTPNPAYTPAPVLTGVPKDITHHSQLTFKANISPLQEAGSYQTIIHFWAVPSF